MRRFLGVAVTLMVVMPGIALAQTPRPPIVELGVQGSKRINDEAPVAWALRLTAPLKRRTAIEVTADIQKSYLDLGESARISAREFSVHWRQTVFTSGRLQIFGVLGGGRNRVERNVPERIAQGGQVEPPYTFVVSEFVAHFGPAVQVELAPWFALRGDVRGTIGQQDSGVRGMVGAVIPIGRFRAGDQPAGSTPPSAPVPAGWQRLKPGREVWVTTNAGALVHGEIAAISDSTLRIRQPSGQVTVKLDEVRLVEGRDSPKNGIFIGAASGAVAGGLLGRSTASDICGSCDINEPIWILLGAVAGGGVGGLLGMMVDGLIPGRQTLFGANTIVVTPVITATRKAVNVTIPWR